ncbi:MAG: hypothetical protein WDO19_23775 [Bacteroidota bacterium]
MDSVIRRVERARKEGMDITADMYTYLAGATGMTSAFPPTLQGWRVWGNYGNACMIPRKEKKWRKR